MKTSFLSPILILLLCVVFPVTSFAKAPLFVFNSDGGAAAIAHITGEVTHDVICHELNELEGTAVTDFFWCPIVGGNVFIYPTNVGERMGDNIRDWDKIHPYYREQGRAMADNLRQLIERGEDPVEILSARAKELGLRFWLSCRMNEIHEDDDRFMVVRSLFKEEHLDWLHGRNYHPEAVYAPKNEWSYAWDYAHEGVRKHFLALFHEWLGYDVDGIELDFVRSPCLFPPGKEEEGAPLLTDFVRKLRTDVNATAKRRGHKVQLAVRVPPSLDLCSAAGIEIKTWIEEDLVDMVIPMDRGYFDPEPKLSEFLPLAKPKGITVLGGIEPQVRNYRKTSRQTFATAGNFLHQGADGIYTFNYDCHRTNAKSSQFGGIGNVTYTQEEIAFLKDALDPAVLRDHDKQYFISQDTGNRLAEENGSRPLRCRLPVGKPKEFTMTVGDDLEAAAKEKRIRSSRLVVALKDSGAESDELKLEINGQAQGPGDYQFEPREPDLVVITVLDPPMRRGANTIKVGLKAGSTEKGIINSIDLNVDYWSPEDRNEAALPETGGLRPVMGSQQLFAYVPTCLDIYIKEPRQVAEPSDWPANLLRFQFPESVTAYGENRTKLWEFSFETSKHAWRVVSKADEKSMGGVLKNRVMECEDILEGAAVIRRTATWTNEQLEFELSVKNLGNQTLSAIQTSMCLQRTAAPDYIDYGNSRTFLVSESGFVPSKELIFHPQKLMFYGHVGSGLELVDKASYPTLKEASLLVVSLDRRFVLCYNWRNATRLFMNRNPRVRCLHSELRFTDIAPQEETQAKGVLFVHEGSLEQAHQRLLAWNG